MKKCQLDLNVQLKELDGTSLDGERNHLGRIVAVRLGGFTAEQAKQNNVGVVKLYDWTRALYNRQPIELDREDLERFTEVVQLIQLPIVVVAQVLEFTKKAEAAIAAE
jgi:hypothetical protein